MAACGFGSSGLKIQNLNPITVRPRFRTMHPFSGLTTQEIVQFEGLVLSHKSNKAVIDCRSLASKDDPNVSVEDNSKETGSNDVLSTLIPKSFEVESLLTVLCDTPSIAEFELKLGGFQLYVSKDLGELAAPPPEPASPAPVTAHSVIETHSVNGSASSPSLALYKPNSTSGGVKALLDKAIDEGLAILKSPRVGFFRRSRTIKGKKAPPSCKEKDGVREGQVLCYIEQLGGEIPIESDVAGEVVKILREDGEPVGYGDALIALLPSFPGIKKLQ